MITLYLKKFKAHDFEMTLNMTLDTFIETRKAVEKKWDEYKAKFPDWHVGCVPRTITSSFLDDVSPTKIHALDSFAFYQDVWVKTHTGKFKKLFKGVGQD